MNKNNNMDKWMVQLRKGTFELAILSLIRTRAMYGYEISAALKTTSHVFSISEGAIYPILKRMTEKGLIEYFWKDSINGPGRKYYQITLEGSNVLTDRLKQFKEIHDALIVLREGDIDPNGKK
ncbi:PadR family transcriptional regulator [Radiobacillus kanasensis]|uniref:PadR family transcriptional regulator n=1 Tax=Radiobacillus kanasensis TaxID=2844358 RepID=UPI001E5F9282|nr:PadR family transcriptional regulator [Radiobacillus kanasensis]UFT99135.1 PadR family transcriptional regulator [Radiobacillus kanasensis]